MLPVPRQELSLPVVGSQLVGLVPLKALLDAAAFYCKKENLFILEEEQRIRLVGRAAEEGSDRGMRGGWGGGRAPSPGAQLPSPSSPFILLTCVQKMRFTFHLGNLIEVFFVTYDILTCANSMERTAPFLLGLASWASCAPVEGPVPPLTTSIGAPCTPGTGGSQMCVPPAMGLKSPSTERLLQKVIPLVLWTPGLQGSWSLGSGGALSPAGVWQCLQSHSPPCSVLSLEVTLF